jgi:hypothetical protein
MLLNTGLYGKSHPEPFDQIPFAEPRSPRIDDLVRDSSPCYSKRHSSLQTALALVYIYEILLYVQHAAANLLISEGAIFGHAKSLISGRGSNKKNNFMVPPEQQRIFYPQRA